MGGGGERFQAAPEPSLDLPLLLWCCYLHVMILMLIVKQWGIEQNKMVKGPESWLIKKVMFKIKSISAVAAMFVQFW